MPAAQTDGAMPSKSSVEPPPPSASTSSVSHDFLAGWCEQRRFEVQEVIGKGSYGVVCAAYDHFTKERVAIKKIQNVFENVADATRILREIKLLRLLKHPDVVEIKHIMLPPDPRTFKDLYVVFELLESDLHTVIGANDDLTHDHHKVFLYQLLRGLNFIHSSGVLHRDLKPKNILANSNCKLKICDFGLARPFLTDTTVTPVHWTDYVATRWYRAPELCGCFYGRYTPAVDVWSVGCIFAEVLLGKPLFPGRDAVSQLQLITDLLGKPSQHTIDRIGNPKARAFLNALPPKQPRPLEQKFPNADPQALAILRRLLCFDASERPSAADALTDPYFSTLPGAAQQDAAAYDRQQFDFELRKMSEEEVRALIYEEALTYHPAVAAAYEQMQSQAQTFASPLSAPGVEMDMRHQFRMASEQADSQQQYAQQQQKQALMQHQVMHPQHPQAPQPMVAHHPHAQWAVKPVMPPPQAAGVLIPVDGVVPILTPEQHARYLQQQMLQHQRLVGLQAAMGHC